MSLLDQLLGGYVYVSESGVVAPTEKTLNFVGATVADDPGNSRTTVTITGGAPSGAASGDLSGTYPGPTVAQLQGQPVSASAPASADVLTWSGSAWAPAPAAGGGGGYSVVYEIDFTTQTAQTFGGASAVIDGKTWTIYGGGLFSGSITGAGMLITGAAGGGSGIGIKLNDLGTCQSNFRIWADMSYVSLTAGSQVFSSVCLNTGTLPGSLDGAVDRFYAGYFQDPVSFSAYAAGVLVYPTLTAETAFLIDAKFGCGNTPGFGNIYIGAMSGTTFPPVGQCRTVAGNNMNPAGTTPGANTVMFYNYVTGGTFQQTVRRLRVETL